MVGKEGGPEPNAVDDRGSPDTWVFPDRRSSILGLWAAENGRITLAENGNLCGFSL